MEVDLRGAVGAPSAELVIAVRGFDPSYEPGFIGWTDLHVRRPEATKPRYHQGRVRVLNVE